MNRFGTVWHAHPPLLMVLAAAILGSSFLTVALEEPLWLALPLLLLVVWYVVVDLPGAFVLLGLLIPLSTELDLPGGVSTDFPVEPYTVGLMGAYLLWVLGDVKQRFPLRFLLHPLSLILLAHWAWIFLTSFSALHPFISFKFFLAKSWYIVVYYFMAGSLLQQEGGIRRFFRAVFWVLFATIFVIVIRHGLQGFSFESANKVMAPFYRNHVDYAAIMTVLFPVLWYWPYGFSKPSSLQNGRGSRRIGKKHGLLILFLLLAIQLTYTRTAYISLLLAAGFYLVLRFGWVKQLLVVATGISVGLLFWLASQNRYLDYAPNYQTTIAHHRFDNLLEATYKLEDISTMERFYRWIAGVQMGRERPFLGYGPGNFYEAYRPYTVSSFKTYVSDNPERSGIHNYFLMLFAEQGLPGLLLFTTLLFYAFVLAERLYHRLRSEARAEKSSETFSGLSANVAARYRLLAVALGLCIIASFLLMNDMIETDKVGTFFFIYLALLVNVDLEVFQKQPCK